MSIVDTLGVPVDQLAQGILLPLLIVFAILWALLNSVKVFNRKINTVLAAALTVMAAMTPQFTIFATYVAQLGIQIALGAFVIVFAAGSVMWAFGHGRDIYYEHAAPSARMERLMKRKQEYMEKAGRAGDEGKDHERAEWLKKAREVQDELDMLSVRR
jgi:hypothetical protein